MSTPIENNTEELRKILQMTSRLPSTQKYGKLVVFGDSMGQGQNNNDYSYVDILRESSAFESVVKACVGGACIGPYQKYASAAGYSLVEQIERYSADVADADIIMCEYGGNDAVAMLEGNVESGTIDDESTAQTVCGYTKKALERIFELNPDVIVQWLPVFPADFGAMMAAMNDTDIVDAFLLFQATALRIARNYSCYVVNNVWTHRDSLVSSDGLHPNTAGHAQIAETILHAMFQNTDYVQIHRPLTLTSTNWQNTSFDGSFESILALLNAGISVTATYIDTAYNMPLVLYPSMYTSDVILFTGTMHNGTSSMKLVVAWLADGTINISEDNSGGSFEPKNISVTSQQSLSPGGTHTVKESILMKNPIYVSLDYQSTFSRVAGSAGNRAIQFTVTRNVSGGLYIYLADFKVSDDGLTLTMNFTKRLKITSSGVTVEDNIAMAFGNVMVFG